MVAQATKQLPALKHLGSELPCTRLSLPFRPFQLILLIYTRRIRLPKMLHLIQLPPTAHKKKKKILRDAQTNKKKRTQAIKKKKQQQKKRRKNTKRNKTG